MGAETEVVPWELERMGQTWGQEAIKVKEAGTEEGLWVFWVSGVAIVFSFSRRSVASISLTPGLVPRIVYSLPRASQQALVTSPRAIAAVGPAMPWICLPVLPGEQLPAGALDRHISGTWKLFNLGWGRLARAEIGLHDLSHPFPGQFLNLARFQPLILG